MSQRVQDVLEEIRGAYNYYQHMEARASQAQVIPDWLVDRFAIAGSPSECRRRVEEIKASGIDQVAIIPYGVGGGDREETSAVLLLRSCPVKFPLSPLGERAGVRGAAWPTLTFILSLPGGRGESNGEANICDC